MSDDRPRVRAVYVISVAAELAGVHPQTLRIYERKGLVAPARTQGGSRRYSDDDVQRTQRIQELMATGLNLEGVRRVIELEARVRSLQTEIDGLRRELSAEADRIARSHRRDLVPMNQSVVVWNPARRS